MKLQDIKCLIEGLLSEAERELEILATENYDIHRKKSVDRERIRTIKEILSLFEEEEE